MPLYQLDKSPCTVRPTIVQAAGTLGCLALTYLKALILLALGRTSYNHLPIALRGFDLDHAGARQSVRLFATDEAVALDDDELFLPRNAPASDLRMALVADPDLRDLGQRIPEGVTYDINQGAGKSRAVASGVVARDLAALRLAAQLAAEQVRDVRRIEKAEAAGINVNLEAATGFFFLGNALGGTATGTGLDFAVIGMHQALAAGHVGQRRHLVLGFPHSAGNDRTAQANALCLLRENALTHMRPGQYAARGFGRVRLPALEPCFHQVHLIRTLTERGAAPSRDDIAWQMANTVFNMQFGHAGTVLAGYDQDVQNDLAGPVDPTFGPRIYCRAGFSRLVYRRDLAVSSLADQIQSKISQRLLGN